MTYIRKIKCGNIVEYLNHITRIKVDTRYQTLTLKNNIKYTENINPDKTRYNYALEYKRGGTLKHCRSLTNKAASVAAMFEKRISKLPHRKTKATIGMCIWSAACPAELLGNPKEMRTFFEVVFKYTVQRYGKDNVFCGFVILDEDTPCIKIPFVPVFPKGDVLCLNAAALITPFELRQYQQDLDKLCAAIFGRSRMILTNGGYSPRKLTEKRKQELAEQKQRIKEQEEYISKLEMINIAIKMLDEITNIDDLAELKTVYTAKQAEIKNAVSPYNKPPIESDIPDNIPPLMRFEWLETRRRWYEKTGSWEKPPKKFSEITVTNKRNKSISKDMELPF